MENKFSNYDDLTLQELVEQLHKLKADLDEAKKEASQIQEIYDFLRTNKIPDKMDEEGISSVTYPDIGRVSLTPDLWASIIAEKKEDAFKWFDEKGLGGIIVPTINAGTLKSTLKTLMKKGDEIPEEIFKVTAYTRASITKIK